MKQKIIELLFKYIPLLAKKLWPGFRDSLIGNKTPMAWGVIARSFSVITQLFKNRFYNMLKSFIKINIPVNNIIFFYAIAMH